jgi:signal transduction histidine kinase
MFDSDFTQTLLERMGGNSATFVVGQDGNCVFTSSNAATILSQDADSIVGKDFADAIVLLTLDGSSIAAEKHPVLRSLHSPDFLQTTPFFCRLLDRPATDTFAVSTIPVVKNRKTEHVIVQIRKAKREVDLGEMKTLFVSFAAHQLKTPSSVVKGFLELMIRQGENAYSADQWHFLTSAFESNENLIAVSKTLLNMARLEGGLIEPDIRTFDPITALKAKISSYGALYSVKQINVEVAVAEDSDAEELKSDESFFTEIFGILLGNAIKHSPAESVIKVVCTLGKTSCEVHVIDNGPGIPDAVKQKLFKKGQDTTEDENSHGLGLYMAKKYISLLGGDIGLSDNGDLEKGGSDFYFSVPNLESDLE